MKSRSNNLLVVVTTLAIVVCSALLLEGPPHSPKEKVQSHERSGVSKGHKR